jgi:hypothetical protein
MTNYLLNTTIELSPDDVTTGMCEDGEFNLAMWREIGDGLHKGLLQDVSIDVLSDVDPADQAGIIQNLEAFLGLLKDRVFNAAMPPDHAAVSGIQVGMPLSWAGQVHYVESLSRSADSDNDIITFNTGLVLGVPRSGEVIIRHEPRS